MQLLLICSCVTVLDMSCIQTLILKRFNKVFLNVPIQDAVCVKEEQEQLRNVKQVLEELPSTHFR